MDSFEWNKILGAVLGTVMFVLVVRIATEAIFEPVQPAKPGYVVEGVQEASSSGTPAAPTEETLPDFGTVLPKADAAAGKEISTRCEQCHDLSKGGPNKIGPDLWGVLGRARATHPGFSYSSAMAADHKPWGFDTLFRFLRLPQAYVPGTKMSFAGLQAARPTESNLLAYLRTQEDSARWQSRRRRRLLRRHRPRQNRQQAGRLICSAGAEHPATSTGRDRQGAGQQNHSRSGNAGSGFEAERRAGRYAQQGADHAGARRPGAEARLIRHVGYQRYAKAAGREVRLHAPHFLWPSHPHWRTIIANHFAGLPEKGRPECLRTGRRFVRARCRSITR